MQNLHQNHRERLRARYLETGFEGFADHEALELLLTFAIPRRDVNPIAHRLLERFGSLENVLKAKPGELTKLPGVGEKTALLLNVCGAMYRRIERQRAAKKSAVSLSNPAEAGRYALALTGGERYECGYVVSLDKNRRVLNHSRVFQGSLTELPLYPRQVVEVALQHRAHSVLLVHNHPSGDARPSLEDAEVTAAVERALSPIGIQLYDHIITGENMAYSFTGKGLMVYTPEGVEAIDPEKIPTLGRRSMPAHPEQPCSMAAE